MTDYSELKGHTPGPWKPSKKEPRTVVNAGGDRWISKAFYEGTGPSPRFKCCPDEAEANASLIAAAPEMLEHITALEARVRELEARNTAAICRANNSDEIIERAAKHWLSLEPGVKGWHGDLADAIGFAVREIIDLRERLTTARAEGYAEAREDAAIIANQFAHKWAAKAREEKTIAGQTVCESAASSGFEIQAAIRALGESK